MAAYPRVQHWHVDGFRVSASVYKSYAEPCITCGRVTRPANIIWAERKTDGMSGRGVFCDEHRPPRGVLPNIDYDRPDGFFDGSADYEWLVGPEAKVVIRQLEHLRPVGDCAVCGAAARYSWKAICQGCSDPARRRRYTVTTVSWSMATEVEERDEHVEHELVRGLLCGQHRRVEGDEPVDEFELAS